MNRRKMLGGTGAFLLMNVTDLSAAQSHPKLYVPAEEEAHERTFMQWPVSRKVYPEKAFLDLVQRTIANIANAIS